MRLIVEERHPVYVRAIDSAAYAIMPVSDILSFSVWISSSVDYFCCLHTYRRTAAP